MERCGVDRIHYRVFGAGSVAVMSLTIPNQRPKKGQKNLTDIRYGIFLRPDPVTCWTITQITHALRQQYGLVAAAAFAPHATLIGNLQSQVSEDELIAILDKVFEGVKPIPTYNSGIERTRKGTFEYNINLDASGERPNEELGRLAAAVKDAVLPVHVRHDDYLAPNVQDYTFAAHLGLASFELHVDNRLSDEVGEFIAGLPIVAPDSFVARWHALFQFRADWSGHWWEKMSSRHVKSWEAVGL